MGSSSSTASRVSIQTPRSPKSQKDAKNASAQKKGQSQGAKDKSKTEAKDVMISYSHADKAIMLKLRDGLEANGISVWVDVVGLQAGVDFLGKIGQAIIDAKMFISLLSENTIKSRYCQDELALAYVSNKAIFPVGLDTPDKLFPNMDTGMKLQLARFSWNLFLDEEKFDENLEKLVSKMKNFLTVKEEEEKGKTPSSSQAGEKGKRSMNKKLHKQMSFTSKIDSVTETIAGKEDQDFWEKHFGNRNSVVWTDFESAFNKQYGDVMKLVFNEEDKSWLIGILRRELRVEDTEAVFREAYTDFCTIDDEFQPFWSCIQDQAVESYTMKEVFNMDSSVRVEAIENLGKFHSSTVVEALLDLLTDKDNNVRSVAAISLARTGAHSKEVVQALMKCLNQKDRLVRESACLALGHLRAEAAVPKLVHLWRNDFISHVREAAQIALEQIGGEEANKAMHITKVLSEEIRTLTEDT